MFRTPRRCCSSRIKGLTFALLGCCCLSVGVASAQGPCTGAWAQDFSTDWISGDIRCSIVYDDGTGPALYVAGQFGGAGGTNARNIAKWDGTRWHALGNWSGFYSPTVSGWVESLGVFNGKLYVGGSFEAPTTDGSGAYANNIAVWDGSVWSALGVGVNTPLEGFGPEVRTMKTFNDGTGEALYVGGWFSYAGGILSPGLAKFDGVAWHQVGACPVGTLVDSLAVYNDGTGDALYVLGDFSSLCSGLIPDSDNLVKYTGVGTGVFGTGWTGIPRPAYQHISDTQQGQLITVHDRLGSALYIKGTGVGLPPLFRWDGAAWSDIPLPLADDRGLAFANRVIAFNDGTGEAMYTGDLHRWDGIEWTRAGDLGTVDHCTGALALGYGGAAFTLADVNFAGPHRLFLGGFRYAFLEGGLDAGGQYVRTGRMATWSPAGGVQPLGTTSSPGVRVGVKSLRVLDPLDGTGPKLYSVGNAPESIQPGSVAVFDGASWRPVTSAQSNNRVYDLNTLVYYNDGTGVELYAGGTFTGDACNAGDVNYADMHKYNRATGQWERLNIPGHPWFSDSVVFDDGTGAALYVAGGFQLDGETFADAVVKWDGHAWSRAGDGIVPSSMTLITSTRLAVVNTGSGDRLIAGGSFTQSGSGAVINRIAQLVGGVWTPLGGGVDGEVLSMAPFTAGGQQKLAISGKFTFADEVVANKVAVWNGASWAELGTGLANSAAPILTAVTVNGQQSLYAAGVSRLDVGISLVKPPEFGPFNLPENRMTVVARWDDATSTWTASDQDGTMGLFATSETLPAAVAYTYHGSPAIYVASTAFANGFPSQGVAAFVLNCPSACRADFDNSGGVAVLDIFAFLGTYFSGDPRADFDNTGGVTVLDIFAFLGAYFTGCP